MGYVDLSTLHTPIGGARPPATYGRQIEANFDFLASPPKCRVHKAAAQNIADAIEVALLFDLERFDTDTMHSTVTNTSRITFTNPGTYDIGSLVKFAAGGGGTTRYAYIRHSVDGDIGGERDTGTTSFRYMQPSSLFHMNAGEYIELIAYQDSGGGLDVTAEFWAIWRSL